MKALVCETLGPPSSLVVREVPEPQPGPGEVVVDVAAAALNFFDTLIIQGRYQYRPELPFSPGAEFAGIVRAVGDGVAGVEAGQRVAGYCGWGACRERVVVEAARLVPVPDGLDLGQAAGLIVTYGTALHALADRGDLQRGETLVVLGAAGGVGLAAVEIGKLMGARVIAVASSPEKLDFCKARGADAGIDYAREDLRQRLRDLAPDGVHMVYDPVGGPHAEPALRALGWKGRFMVIGFAAGEIPRIPLNLVLLKGCDIRGVFWGRFTETDPDGHRANMRRLLDWAAAGSLSLHVHARHRLDDGVAALEAIARREVLGKVLIEI